MKSFLPKNMLGRYFLSHLLLISLLVGFIGLVLTYNISSNIKKEISANNLDKLSNINSIIEKSVLSPSRNLVLSAVTSYELQSVNPNKPESCFVLYQYLKKQVELKPYIESLNVYFPSYAMIISSSEIRYDISNHRDYDFTKILKQNGLHSNELWYGTRIIESSPYDLPVTTYIFSPKRNQNPPFYVYININETYIKSVLQSINTGQNNSAVIVDSENKVISITGLDNSMNNTLDLSGLTKNSNGNQIIKNLDGKDAVVSYIHSSFNNWCYVIITPLNVFFQVSNNIQRTIILVCFSTFLASILLSFAFSKKLYFPLKQILGDLFGNNQAAGSKQNEYLLIAEKINHLNQTITSLKSKVNETVFYELLHGSLKCFDENVMKSMLPNDESIVITLKLRPNESCDLINEQFFNNFAKFHKSYIITENKDQFIIITNFSSGNEIYGQIEVFFTELKNNLPISFKIGVGTSTTNPYELNISYEQAKAACKYIFIKPDDFIIHYKDICDLNDISQFINCNELKTSLENLNLQKMELFFQKFTDILHARSFRYESIENLIFNVINIFSKKFSDMNLNKAMFSSYKIFKEFYNKNNIFESLSWFVEMAKNILTLEKEENSRYEIIHQIKQYIDNNYDKDISLELFSQMFFISPSYISVLFKNIYNIGLSDYVSGKRLDKAKELLENKYLKIEDIAEKVGIHNYSYFATKFKSRYGLSPNQYRSSVKSREMGATITHSG